MIAALSPSLDQLHQLAVHPPVPLRIAIRGLADGQRQRDLGRDHGPDLAQRDAGGLLPDRLVQLQVRYVGAEFVAGVAPASDSETGFLDWCASVAVAERVGHENATLVLKTYGHLMPGSEDRSRRAIDTAWTADGLQMASDRA
jgi:hypothetical protein